MKKQYFSNITVSDVTCNKIFWKSVKPYLSNKGLRSNKITLIENDAFITNGRVISKTMNKLFINTAKNSWKQTWRRGVVVITTAQLHSIKPELRLYAGSNPARSVSEIRDGEDLLQWSCLEIRLNAFHRSTIPQKQFIIIKKLNLKLF